MGVIAMTWLQWFKAFHVLAAVVWVGGGVIIAVLATMIARANDPALLARFSQSAGWVGERVYVPASLLALLTGIGLLTNGNSPFDWDTTWVQISLAGWILTAAVGTFYLGPTAKRLAKAVEAKGPEDAEVQALIRRILLVDRIDVIVLVVVVFVMTAKPWS